jgi:hypothetical protein
MAAFTLYDVLRHLVQGAAFPNEEDKRAALDSITEAESLGVLGNTARSIGCPHTELLNTGNCAECGRQVQVGHAGVIGMSTVHRQGWRQ